MKDRPYGIKSEQIINCFILGRFGKAAKKRDRRIMNKYRRSLEKRDAAKEAREYEEISGYQRAR